VLQPHRTTLPPWSLSQHLSLFSRGHAKSGADARLRPRARQIGWWRASLARGTPDRAGDSRRLAAPPRGCGRRRCGAWQSPCGPGGEPGRGGESIAPRRMRR
jgi:hypothetical protein